MTEPQFFEWMAAYKRRFLGPSEHDVFIFEWKPDVLKLELADALEAIGDIGRDPRPEANFPRQHLRLLLEYADQRQTERERANLKPFVWPETNPPPCEAWDQTLLNRGIITKAEFNKRRKERAK